MHARRWALSALVSFSLVLVGSVSFSPATATAEPTPTATTDSSAPTASPAPSPVQTAEAVASADVVPPVLTGVSVSPAAVKPGDTLTMTYTYTDDSPLAAASFEFWNRSLDAVVYTDSVAPVAGSHQVTLKSEAINGDYVLRRVRLKDAAGNESDFRADGTVRGTPNPPASGTHSIDFSKVLFTVSGSILDTEPPVLTSLSLTSAARYEGDPTTWAYTVTDRTLPLNSVQLTYVNPTTQMASTATTSEAPASGTVTSDAPLPTGVNQLDSVTIFDGRGYWSTYRRNGTLSDALGGTGAHEFDFSKLDVSVLPAAPGVVARPMPRGMWLHWSLTNTYERAILSGYRVTVSPGSTVTIPVRAEELQTHVVSGLANGTAHTVSVTPLTQWGDGKTFTATVTPMPSRNIFGSLDITGDRKTDVIAHRRRAVLIETAYLYPGNGVGGFLKPSAYEQTLGYDVSPGGDTDGDGRGDLLLVNEHGTLTARHSWGYQAIGTGWGSMRFIDGGADFSGDGRTDILAVTKAGELYLYRVSYDRIVSSSKIGSGWGGMHSFFTPGDWSGDGKADIVAMDAAGDLWLYRGTGTGGFLSRLKIGVGWAGFGAVLPMRDFNGDGRADIGAVTMSGDLLLYPGNGRSGFHAPKKIGVGWHVFF